MERTASFQSPCHSQQQTCSILPYDTLLSKVLNPFQVKTWGASDYTLKATYAAHHGSIAALLATSTLDLASLPLTTPSVPLKSLVPTDIYPHLLNPPPGPTPHHPPVEATPSYVRGGVWMTGGVGDVVEMTLVEGGRASGVGVGGRTMKVWSVSADGSLAVHDGEGHVDEKGSRVLKQSGPNGEGGMECE